MSAQFSPGKLGEVVTSIKLKNAYGRYAVKVLFGGEFVKDVETKRAEGSKRRPVDKYKWVKTPPTQAEFCAARDAKYKTTIAGVIGDAFGELSSLKEELEEWHGNLPESFQSGDKGQELEEAVQALEECCNEPDFPEWVGNIELIDLPGLDVSSRSDRCGEAVRQLNLVLEKLEALIADPAVKEKDELAELHDELETTTENADSVSFPGMY